MKIELELFQMKIIMLFLIASAIGFPINIYAADISVGSISCKEWIEDRASESDYTNKYVDQSWVVGFISGYAVVSGTDSLLDIKIQAMYIWMDKYCASHPLKKVEDGAVNLVHELVRKTK
jgi:hypothetical protein